MTAPAQPEQPLRERIFAWLDEDDHDLTPEQIEYNVAAGELIQLGAYGHCKYWPAGELHPREYLSRLHSAQDRFTDALLGLVQPDLDVRDAEIQQLRAQLADGEQVQLGLRALWDAAEAENARLRAAEDDLHRRLNDIETLCDHAESTALADWRNPQPVPQ